MSDQRFDVIFSGKVRDGFAAAEVKANFSRLFKIPAEKVESIFRSPRTVLKSGVDRETADKYQAVLAKTGAIVTVEPQRQDVPPPPPEATTPAVNAPVEEAPQTTPAAGPIWGRRFENSPVNTAVAEDATDNGEHQYGSLADALAGNYQFTIGGVLSEAWQKVNGNKATALLAFLLGTGVMIGVGIAAGLIQALLGALAGDMGGVAGGFLTQIAQLAVGAPLNAGFFMLGISMALGVPAGAALILKYYDRILPLTLTMILYGLMVMLGFVLLVLPGIYLSVAYLLAIPLVVDKGLSPWQALEASRKAITHRWFSVFGFLLLMGLISIIGTLCLLIGLIWIIPLYMIAMGILYRNIFGVSSIPAGASVPASAR